MSGHTPGPWTCHTFGFITADRQIIPHYVLNKTGNTVQAVSQDEAHDNARLIAAAPELLETLKECGKLLRDMLDREELTPEDMDLEIQVVAAIAKAEGTSEPVTKQQPEYTDCANCGTVEHQGYACPCMCHAGH